MKKGILIVGGTGSGKTTRAKVEAEKICRDYAITSWGEISGGGFGLGRVLGPEPLAVIVEELPYIILQPEFSKPRAFFKQLVSPKTIMIHEPYKNPRPVPTPIFIFTMLPPPFPLPVSGLRVQVIDLSQSPST